MEQGRRERRLRRMVIDTLLSQLNADMRVIEDAEEVSDGVRVRMRSDEGAGRRTVVLDVGIAVTEVS